MLNICFQNILTIFPSVHVCVCVRVCTHANLVVSVGERLYFCVLSEYRIFFSSFSYFIILGKNGIKSAGKASPWLDVKLRKSCQKEINNNNPQQRKIHNCMLKIHNCTTAEKCSFDSTEIFFCISKEANAEIVMLRQGVYFP